MTSPESPAAASGEARPVKIGIMSFAHLHGAGYAGVLAGRPDIELRAADENADRGKPIADGFGIPFTSSYAELLDWQPDAVIVCSENARHRVLVEQAAAAGAHVLCEKPLATSLVDGRAMIDACEAAGVTLMTAFPVRFARPVVGLAKLAHDGALGRIHGAAGTNPGRMPGGWFVDPDLAGGGAVMDHTVHVADLLRWILGVEAVEVYAQVNRILYPDLPVETAGTLAITFADGTVATIDCSWGRPKSYPTWGGVTLELVGEQGIATADAFGQTINSYHDGPGRAGGQDVAWSPWGDNPDASMLAEFIAAIREGRQPRPDGWDGYRATEIAFGAYLSAESGQPVSLPLPVDG
ncbi:Gfo/Idh/MocA family protein [Actinopolymorpha alba]|uniref:Gfo/Idh/MocA family protein n=1 Tax=Actinopolymorpha alba TaxID=533267 RepID=UPI00037DD562|nr:Gfo/Idh/MocA family oxidoreductase [Actinopolymorpha alba]